MNASTLKQGKDTRCGEGAHESEREQPQTLAPATDPRRENTGRVGSVLPNSWLADSSWEKAFRGLSLWLLDLQIDTYSPGRFMACQSSWVPTPNMTRKGGERTQKGPPTPSNLLSERMLQAWDMFCMKGFFDSGSRELPKRLKFWNEFLEQELRKDVP